MTIGHWLIDLERRRLEYATGRHQKSGNLAAQCLVAKQTPVRLRTKGRRIIQLARNLFVELPMLEMGLGIGGASKVGPLQAIRLFVDGAHFKVDPERLQCRVMVATPSPYPQASD